MSRIGKMPVAIPSGVEVNIDKNVVNVTGPKGKLSQEVNSDLTVAVEDGQVVVSRPTEQKRHKAMHGLYRSLIANMIEGVSNGYKIELELVGVGYRAAATGQMLELSVGYSHPVIFMLPPEINVSAEMVKGQNPKISLEAIDKQLIGQMAAKIRSIRKPEPYKGKGIRYVGEHIRRKAGKSASAK